MEHERTTQPGRPQYVRCKKIYFNHEKCHRQLFHIFISVFFSFVVIGIFHSCKHGTHRRTTSCVGTCKTHSLQTVCHSTLKQWMTTVRCKPTVYPALLWIHTNRKREREEKTQPLQIHGHCLPFYILFIKWIAFFPIPIYVGIFGLPNSPHTCHTHCVRVEVIFVHLQCTSYARYTIAGFDMSLRDIGRTIWAKTNKQTKYVCFRDLSFIEKPPKLVLGSRLRFEWMWNGIVSANSKSTLWPIWRAIYFFYLLNAHAD